MHRGTTEWAQSKIKTHEVGTEKWWGETWEELQVEKMKGRYDKTNYMHK